MKIISSAQEIQDLLIKAIEKYKSIRFSVAWASENHDVSKILFKNISKIVSSTVGLHFSQTHPDFIKKFINDVKFIKNEHGIFHPKVYLFFNDENDWQCLIGSANFTKSALTENSEVMTYFSSNDDKKLFFSINRILDNYSDQAQFFDEKNLEGYRADWERKNKAKEKNDNYKFRGKSKSIPDMKWDEYYLELMDNGKNLSERLILLAKSKQYFQNDFKCLSELERKNISGVKKAGGGINNWFLFGHMPSQYFANRVSDQDKNGESGAIKSYMKISEALNHIPLNGEVSKKDFDACIEYFKTHPSWGYSMSTVSRLLTMKRPDQFFCVTGINNVQGKGNFEKLKNNFGIAKKIKTYEEYWEMIIQNVRKTPWYKSVEPTNELELQAWKARVALMDALFYNE